MPDEEKPEPSNKPVRFVFPRGISAEEAAKRVKELLEKHGHAPKQQGEHDGGDSEAKP
jgi:hypothetical protein